MCGICGEVALLGRKKPDPVTIKEIASRLAHRGPDDEGYFSEANVSFGHRRLSIIDIEKSRQPMVSDDKSAVLVFNGEIYNYTELRTELETLGFSFRSSGDTEVLLKAYLAWKDKMLPKLNGMFAFVIYDFRDNTMLMARDRFGQKPLVYCQTDNGMLFSSELKPLLLHPAVKRTLDKKGCLEYLMFQNVMPSETIIEGIKKMPAAHALTYDASSGRTKMFRYYSPVFDTNNDLPGAPSDSDLDALEDVLVSSIGRHLRSDVPFGFYLSGGIDSTILVTLASKFSLGGGLTTFTVSHYDPSFDEGPSAARTAALLKTNHREKKITSAEYTDDILEVLTRIDEPIADPGAIASFMVTKHAAEFVKVVVTGNGGDEFFYGYEPYLRYGLARLLSSMPSFLRDDVFPSMLKLVPGDFGYMGMALKAGIFLEGLKYPEHLRNTAWLAAFPPDECPDALHPLVKQNCAEFIKDTGMFFMNLYGKYSGCGSLERLAADFQSVYLPDSICAHTDKTSMMHSIEARSPFLDNELTSFVNNLPEKWKLNGGVSKYALRLLIKRHLGRTPVINGPKRGFTVPVAKLLRGPLLDQAELYFSDEICDYCGIFNNEYVSRIWHDHKTGRKNHYRKLWTIFTLHHWIKTNIL